MNNKGFSALEILIVIVIASVVLIGGILIAFGTKKSTEMRTFQENAGQIISSAKQAYNNLKKEESSYIVNNGTSNGMCITLKGLESNDLYSKNLKDATGYIVIEEKGDDITYTLWLHNKKFIINGIDAKQIENEKNEKVVKDYNNEDFSAITNGTFKGNHGSYTGTCIDKKI